jgi:polar amino acid transport system substrate-binding protein
MAPEWPRWIRFSLGICLVGVSAGVPSVSSGAAFSADLSAIQARGRLIVAVKDNLRPLGFRDSTGKLQGFEIDIAQRLAADLLGRPDAAVLQPVRNQDRLRLVLEGQVDVAIAQVTCTPSRARIVAFSLPYYFDGVGLITRDPTIQTIRDVTTQAIAVLNGSSAVDTLRYQFPAATLVPVISYAAGQALLESGGAIALAADATVLSGWAQELPQYRLLRPTLAAAPFCMVIAKGRQSDELRRRIDEILRKWKAEGWLRSRADYWGLP